MTSSLIRVGLLLVLMVGIVLAVVYRDRFDVLTLERWIQEAGIWAPLLFMAVYAVAAVLFLPGSLLTLAGGAFSDRCWVPFIISPARPSVRHWRF